MSASKVCAEEMREHLSYDKTTGLLYWKKNFHKSRIGKVAGCIKKNGYTRVVVNWVSYGAARIIWAIEHGSIDEDMVIDHIDRNPRNNRLSNLRMVTTKVNCNNKKTKLGEDVPRFYTKHKTGKFQVIYKGVYIGLFDDEKAAITEVNRLSKESK